MKQKKKERSTYFSHFKRVRFQTLECLHEHEYYVLCIYVSFFCDIFSQYHINFRHVFGTSSQRWIHDNAPLQIIFNIFLNQNTSSLQMYRSGSSTRTFSHQTEYLKWVYKEIQYLSKPRFFIRDKWVTIGCGNSFALVSHALQMCTTGSSKRVFYHQTEYLKLIYREIQYCEFIINHSIDLSDLMVIPNVQGSLTKLTS